MLRIKLGDPVDFDTSSTLFVEINEVETMSLDEGHFFASWQFSSFEENSKKLQNRRDDAVV